MRHIVIFTDLRVGCLSQRRHRCLRDAEEAAQQGDAMLVTHVNSELSATRDPAHLHGRASPLCDGKVLKLDAADLRRKLLRRNFDQCLFHDLKPRGVVDVTERINI